MLEGNVENYVVDTTATFEYLSSVIAEQLERINELEGDVIELTSEIKDLTPICYKGDAICNYNGAVKSKVLNVYVEKDGGYRISSKDFFPVFTEEQYVELAENYLTTNADFYVGTEEQISNLPVKEQPNEQ